AKSEPNPFLDSPSELVVYANESKPNPFFDSPISDEYSRLSSQDSPLDVMRTPGSAAGSAFTPIKPSVHIDIDNWDTPVTPKSDKENSTSIPSSTNIDIPEENALPSSDKVKGALGAKTALFREQVRKNVPSVNSNKVKEALEERKRNLLKNMEQVKKSVPKPMSMKPLIRSSKANCIDLSHLSVVTISIVPRLGTGMRSGRMPFERMRTSLMLHLMQEIKTKSWTKQKIADGKKGRLDQEEVVSKLNNMLYDCIANGESSFVEKSQDIVKVAREAVEEIKDSTDKSFTKTEVGLRNLLSAKFLSSGYREIIADEKFVSSSMKEGVSMMIVASAYYALGKFESALEAYQRAGDEMKKKITASSPEYIAHCTKLFNNMGCVYFEMKKYDKAMKTWQRALELCNDENEDYASWTSCILDQASIMNNMAYLLIKFRQFDDATDLIDSSFELQRIIPEFNNQIMNIATLSTMGFIYYQTKQHKASFDTYKACVQLQENTSQHNERDKADVLTKMAANCKKMNDHAKRVLILRCILVYQQCYLLDDDDEIWETNAALAESLQEYADAGGQCL
ncbi:hypothetical protein ACHAWT_009579, partial [Skeletonema menzelii]